MTGSGITGGAGGGGIGDPGDDFLLLLVAAPEEDDEELDRALAFRLLREGMFTKIKTAMRRRIVAITAAAMMPPWTILRVEIVVQR